MTYVLLYFIIGGLVALPLSDTLKNGAGSQYLIAIGITVLAWPLIVMNAVALIYTHWDERE